MGFYQTKQKKWQLSQPTYCSSHRYHPLQLITFLICRSLFICFLLQVSPLGAQKIRCVFFFFSYNFHFILLIIHNIPFTLGCCFHRMVLGFTSCSSSSSLGMQIGLWCFCSRLNIYQLYSWSTLLSPFTKNWDYSAFFQISLTFTLNDLVWINLTRLFSLNQITEGYAEQHFPTLPY